MDVLGVVLMAVETLVKTYPYIKQGFTDLKPYAVALWEKLSGKEITPEDRTVLENGVDALFARLMQPLPPAQPGDPDYKVR